MWNDDEEIEIGCFGSRRDKNRLGLAKSEKNIFLSFATQHHRKLRENKDVKIVIFFGLFVFFHCAGPTSN